MLSPGKLYPKDKMTRIASALVSVNGLDTEKRVRVLGIIDKIRELGVSEDVSLPQVRQQFELERNAHKGKSSSSSVTSPVESHRC
jgi:hypothetical protein